ncbi:MAG TPA: sulfotransferase [Rhizomicrobium sp.]|nr:sulfotransferase [Rhizomicrobium sp.]
MAEHALDLLARLTAAFDQPQPAPSPPAAAPERARAAFVVGFPRSGTTLLGRLLASRPGVSVLEERHLVGAGVAEYVDAPDGPAKLMAATEADIARHRAEFFRRAAAQGADQSATLIVDQTALNTVYLPLILKLFPEAPVVFAVRDPRDVVFACFRRMFAPNAFTMEMHTLGSTARLYDGFMRLAEIARSRLGFAPLDVRNEALIEDFDGQTQRLCAHAGLAWDESIRAFQHASQGRALVTRSAAQVRSGLSRESLGVWRRYREEMAPVLPILEPWVRRFGYAEA